MPEGGREYIQAMYLYLSLIPEALIASMLPPEEFGAYLAVGTRKRTLGQAMFFAVEGLKSSTAFDLREAERRCVPHPDGEPPGQVRPFYLYQELCPVHPRIVSDMDPVAFVRHITAPGLPMRLPRVCFVDLRLGELARDPEQASIHDLPYHAIEHLRDCLIELKSHPSKGTKTVDRNHPQSFPFRSVETGVYVGDEQELVYYPFPSARDLQTRHYEWWRSASLMGDLLGSY